MTSSNALVAGRYRLAARVGVGGMGVVWRAWDERLERTVALKQLHPRLTLSQSESELARSRAMREARLTARLKHPHAISVFDVVDHEGQPWLVMEFLPSVPLSALLKGLLVLSLDEALRIGVQVGSALAAAHQLGIVHRDVKPGNILVADDGTAKISDFGIAHALDDVNHITTGLVQGTPAYLAPEVARGERSGFPTDVHGLGATLYAAVEGSPPFGTDQNSMALLQRVASGTINPPHRSGALTPLLLLMLSADPKDRPVMTEVVQSLEILARDATTAVAAPLTATAHAAPLAPTPPEAAPEASEHLVARAAPRKAAEPATLRSRTRSAESQPRDKPAGPRRALPPAPTPKRSPRRRLGGRTAVAAATAATALGVAILVAAVLTPLYRNGADTPGQPAAGQPSASVLATTSSRPSPGSASATGQPQGEPPTATYTSDTFSVPFQVAIPTWVAAKPYTEQSNLVSWRAADVAIRFLVPLSVYPAGSGGAAPPPKEYLPYLLGQVDRGVRVSDRSATTVGGRPATLVTATADRRLLGLIGCPRTKMLQTQCYGLRPERRLRIAIVDLNGRTLLIWLRNDRRARFDEQRKLFEQTLASVSFT